MTFCPSAFIYNITFSKSDHFAFPIFTWNYYFSSWTYLLWRVRNISIKNILNFQFQQIRAAIWKGEINVQSLSNLVPGSKKSFFRVSKINNNIGSCKIIIHTISLNWVYHIRYIIYIMYSIEIQYYDSKY